MKKYHKSSKRVEVRPFSISDYTAWEQTYSNLKAPQNDWDNISVPPESLNKSYFKTLQKKHQKNLEKDTRYDLAIFCKKTSAYVGVVCFMEVQRFNVQSAYIGYYIHNQFWGQGFAKEGIKLALQIAFKDIGLHRVEAGIEPRNRRSIMLARKIGFRKEGTKKRVLFKREGWRDLVIYAMTCEEFGVPWKMKNFKTPI